ncbi:nitroreductase family deazaflavin-dependent oxidoreductase [Nonomuraea maheshkhaliensis]|uniref:Nitroreductase family deazaflavin-dependent oxidoreductase n=1 Tax=Nonomuraea maheshkhaliensis TaxID=419590 RepID=A0ABP4RLC6_9ACTN
MSDSAATETAGGWKERVIAEFRANGGYVRWSTDEEIAAGRPIPARLPGFEERGLPLILVHHTGARTGRERISPLFFQPVGDGWAVFGTNGGSTEHPLWYRNLMAHPRATVEVGTETVPVTARPAEGAERERIWAKQTALVPRFAAFEAASGRQVPVVVLEPADRP